MVTSLLLFLTASFAWGQAERQEPPLSKGTTLKATTDVVNVYAIVRDKSKRLIPNLGQKDFELRENDARQEVRYFSRETDTPLTLGILIDTSPSQERVLGIEQEQAKSFVRQVVRARDLAFVIHFDYEVEILQDFTADRERLASAVDSTVVRGGGLGAGPSPEPAPRFPLPFPAPGGDEGGAPWPVPCQSWLGGDTHLNDAVYLAAKDLLKNEVGRKVLLVLGDGVDQGSRVKLAAALEAAQRSDVIIYSVAIVDSSLHTDFCRKRRECFGGASVLKRYAEETGGRVITVGRAQDTAEAFREIAEELRTQYLLGYTPTERRRDGSYRKIQVRARHGEYRIQARRGYYAPTR